MKGIIVFLVKFFTGNKESYNLNVGVLISVLLCLSIALIISFILAKKNHLYGKSSGLDDIIESER